VVQVHIFESGKAVGEVVRVDVAIAQLCFVTEVFLGVPVNCLDHPCLLPGQFLLPCIDLRLKVAIVVVKSNVFHVLLTSSLTERPAYALFLPLVA